MGTRSIEPFVPPSCSELAECRRPDDTVSTNILNTVTKPQRFGAELGLGGAYGWAGGKYALHGEALAATSFEGSRSLKGTVGFTMGF
ncbi:hypothetical protein M2281_002346 [Mesorhizobium soli]|nr:hypothetical protein [Mesorhizobium soli]